VTDVLELATERLLLRQWREEDREPFARLNADPVAMEHFPSTLTREESDALVDRIEQHFAGHGFGLWAVEVVGGAPFIGFVGLNTPGFEADFLPCVEVGWRLLPEHWGHGYATEAARAALAAACGRVGLGEVESWTVPATRPAWAVMERLGLTHDPADDFDHPRVPEGSPLRRHVRYRISRERWRQLEGSDG
jgi:ribosomal-protein-alanine N-acetyltransferase